MSEKARAGVAVSNEGEESGFALIVVLWLLVLLAGIGAVLLANGRNEVAAARNLRLAASAEALADAGIAQAVFNLEDTIPAKHWPLDGKPHRLLLLGGEVVIRLEDENAKINPNRASDVLVAALLETTGVEPSRAERIGGAIADWVSSDVMPRPQGAKREQYETAGLSYGPPNAPAESLDELQLVLGMTPQIFAGVRPYLTIFSERDKPSTDNAAPAVLQAVKLAALRQTRRDVARERAVRESTPTAFDPDAPDVPMPQSAAGDAQPQSADQAKAVQADIVIATAEVTAHTSDGGVFVRLATLKLEPSKPKGYSVLEWRRGRLPAN